MHDWTPEAIKAFRLARHESQVDFARHFGLDQSAVSLWETGGNRPSGPALVVLNMLAASTPASEAA